MMVPNTGTIRSMIMGLFTIFTRKSTRKPVVKVIRPQQPKPRVVQPDNTPLYVKRGWTIKGNTYQGYYRTVYGAWRGEIIRRGDKFNVFIFNPPVEQIKDHSRWQCFHQVKNDKWRINLAINPKDGDISAIIFYVERIIIESFSK
jgi:hypothetical protein